MFETAMIKTAIDSGLSIGIFALCVWLVTTIVKNLCGTIDRLNANMDKFTEKVEVDHQRAVENQKSLMEQHNQMIETLGRINGYKK